MLTGPGRDTKYAVEGAERRASGAWRRLTGGKGGTVGTGRSGTPFEGEWLWDEAPGLDTVLSILLFSCCRVCCFLGLLFLRSHNQAWKGWSHCGSRGG